MGKPTDRLYSRRFRGENVLLGSMPSIIRHQDKFFILTSTDKITSLATSTRHHNVNDPIFIGCDPPAIMFFRLGYFNTIIGR